MLRKVLTGALTVDMLSIGRCECMKWFEFFDMSSGGSEKTDHSVITIEAQSVHQAISIFEHTFDRDPLNVTCDCCGSDFSISQVEKPNKKSFIIKKEMNYD